MTRTLTLLFTLLLLMAHAAMGQATRPDSARQAAWETFKEQEGETWRIRWDESTGLPRTLVGGATRPYTGEAEAAARAFLSDYRSLFGMKANLSDLRHMETQVNRNIHHVTFQQYYEGVRVEDAQYKVHLREDGRVGGTNGFYYPDIKVPTTPKVTESQAIQIAKADLDVRGTSNLQVTSELVIYPDEEAFHLAWRLVLFSEQPLIDWFYLVDAHTGAVLSEHNRVMDAAVDGTPYHTQPESFSTDDSNLDGYNSLLFLTGEGKTYPTHPGLSTVTDIDLFRLNGTGYLQGTYVNVLNDVSSEAYSASNEFLYGTGNTHFDEVNLYYHVDKFRHGYIEGLGNLGFTQITAHAHTNTSPGPNNAWFSRFSGDIYFGDGTGTGFNPFAKEDKAIYHEYSHAVIYDMNTGIISSSSEEGAISEGVPDYFAGAHTGRPVIFEYAAPAYQRDMTDPTIDWYSEFEDGDPPEAHDGGEFFSAILWDLRNAPGISGGQADFLVFDALSQISSNPNFEEFRDAMIMTDNSAYSGNHVTLIENTFCDWGIDMPLEVELSGPAAVPYYTFGMWTADVSCNGASSYAWYRRYISSPNWSWVGTSPSYGQNVNEAFYLKVVVTRGSDEEEDMKYIIPAPLKYAEQTAELAIDLPETFALHSNHPNPFNPSTEIRFDLPEAAHVRLVVYDVLGREVARLVDREMAAGYQHVTWEAGNVPSGVYLYRIEAGNFSQTRSMILQK